MKLEFYIRSLARSAYWQEIYRTSKECNGIYLFQNSTNISGLQYIFLYWLRIYELLYNEMSQKSWPHLTINIIKDDIRCDAFLYWRKTEINKQNHAYKKNQRKAMKNHKKGMQNFSVYKGKK